MFWSVLLGCRARRVWSPRVRLQARPQADPETALSYSKGRMGKETTFNRSPEIIKELGIALSFPRPLSSLNTKPQGFRNFLLAYSSGFYMTTDLLFISSIVKKIKKQQTTHHKNPGCYRKILSWSFQYFLPVTILLFPAAQEHRSDSHKYMNSGCLWWFATKPPWDVYYLNVCLHPPKWIFLKQQRSKENCKCTYCLCQKSHMLLKHNSSILGWV